MFFDEDHVEEILFPQGRILRRKKEQYWFPLIRNFIHTLGGAKFYADLFWLEWQYQGNRPSDEAVQLRTRLFQLTGGPSRLNLSIDDMHAESIRNPTEYTPDQVAKLYILISRWDAPVTPDGRERRAAQKDDRDRDRATTSSTRGRPMPPPGRGRVSAYLARGSAARRGQARLSSRSSNDFVNPGDNYYEDTSYNEYESYLSDNVSEVEITPRRIPANPPHQDVPRIGRDTKRTRN